MATFVKPDIMVDLRGMNKKVRKAVRSLQGRQLSQLMDKLEGLAAETVDLNFRVAGRPRPWRRLSTVTIARRRKGKKSAPGAGRHAILQDTGALRLSVGRSKKQGRPRGAIRLTRGRVLMFGTNLPYAAAHQYGLPRRKGEVPAHTRRAHTRRTSRGKRVAVRAHYVRAHQTTLPAIPKRPFLVVPRTDQKYYEQMVLEHVIASMGH